jgi:DNA-directed RNA polymerase subunit L
MRTMYDREREALATIVSVNHCEARYRIKHPKIQLTHVYVQSYSGHAVLRELSARFPLCQHQSYMVQS